MTPDPNAIEDAIHTFHDALGSCAGCAGSGQPGNVTITATVSGDSDAQRYRIFCDRCENRLVDSGDCGSLREAVDGWRSTQDEVAEEERRYAAEDADYMRTLASLRPEVGR